MVGVQLLGNHDLGICWLNAFAPSHASPGSRCCQSCFRGRAGICPLTSELSGGCSEVTRASAPTVLARCSVLARRRGDIAGPAGGYDAEDGDAALAWFAAPARRSLLADPRAHAGVAGPTGVIMLRYYNTRAEKAVIIPWLR